MRLHEKRVLIAALVATVMTTVATVYAFPQGNDPKATAGPLRNTAAVRTTEGAPRTVRAKSQEGKWSEYPTRLLSDLSDFSSPATAPALTSFGGWRDKKVDKPGFFRARKIGERWWLVDPTGCLTINVGMNAVSVSGTPTATSNRDAAFGGKEKWAERTSALLQSLGFYTAGCWSDTEALTKTSVEHRLPYTRIWNFMSEYGKIRGGTYQKSGHIGYPNDAIFVFDPEFETFADKHAKQLAAAKDDPYLLGHFSDNELPFLLKTLDNFLKLEPGDPGREAVDAWLKARNVTPADITDADRDAWRGYVADRYFAITTKAIRKYDPNHLCLGSRIHGQARRSDAIFRAAGKYLDVIAVNDYNVWTPTPEYIGRFTALSGKPILITEWYAKGEDSGMGNKGGAGWTVATQKERGWFYQNYVLGLLQSPNCVGWHWFKYADNDPTNTQADPSNRDSNKGIVNNKFEMYTPLVESMRELNRNVYPLTMYFDKKGTISTTVKE